MIACVTQYLRPDGRQVLREVEIDDHCMPQYELFHSYGCRLTCEQLQTGHAVQYISHALGDFRSVISSPYSPEEAIEKLEEMILTFSLIEFEEWKKQMENEENDR